jgi:hypoxanthine phosphoribosyltransferase
MDSRPKLNILFSRDEIEATVRRLATEISRDYRDRFPLLIGILRGSFVFMADLIRQLDFPLEVDFIGAASYGCSTRSSGQVKLNHRLQSEVRGREVLLVEDIVDTGLTTACLLDHLRRKKPASLKLCALTDKPSRRKVPVTIDYLGFTVPDRFLVGYGLDLGQKFRNLPDICALEEA